MNTDKRIGYGVKHAGGGGGRKTLKKKGTTIYHAFLDFSSNNTGII